MNNLRLICDDPEVNDEDNDGGCEVEEDGDDDDESPGWAAAGYLGWPGLPGTLCWRSGR